MAMLSLSIEAKAQGNDWVVDRFDDIKVLRYEVPGFEELTLKEKLMVYYLSEAAKAGRDILYDQNFKYNLPIRRTLETLYKSISDRDSKDFFAFEKYLKKVWFANGIHHHYSNDKFQPEFSELWLRELERFYQPLFYCRFNGFRQI